MATRRILTRLQAKKQDNLLARKESSPAKRKAAVRAMEGIEDENAAVDTWTASLHKSYPLDNEATSKKMSRRKSFKTDNPGKQRQTLSDRGTNFLKTSNGQRKESITDRSCEKYNTKSPILCETTRDNVPAEEDISQEEIIELDEQTTVDELMCEESMAAALPPPMNTNYQEHIPHFYTTPFVIDSSMDTDPWRKQNERFKPLPFGVIDIDCNSDTLNTSIYSFDIIEYLKEKELHSQLPPSSLETSPEVTPRMRGVLMDWLIQVQIHEELQEETLHLCVALIDRYLASVRVRMPRLQLVGITCLLIATKFLERYAPEISALCYLTAHTFKPSQVITYEMQVLLTLAFDLTIPVSVTFLRRYLQVHADEQSPEVTFLAYYLLDLSITSARMASVLPSMLAASAIYLARRLVIGTSHAWTASLAYYTSYNTPSDLSETVNELASLLLKAPSSKFQGARNKFNVEHYSFISHSSITSVQSVATHFATQVSSV